MIEEIPYAPQSNSEKLPRNEFDTVLNKLKNNNAPGEEEITGELIKNSSPNYKNALFELISYI